MPLKLNVKMEIPGKEAREFLYEFDQDVITLGRDSRNDIQIPLTTVSRSHARIMLEGGEYFIEDLNSTHGSVHNAKPIGKGGKKLLRDGDTIQIMHFKILYQRVSDKPLEFASSEKTEQLARRMVQEVLASMGEANEQPYLRVMNGPDEGKRFELSEAIAEVVIGRSSDTDLVINDANISRRHAIVRKDWGGITIEDMGSKNGVVINERKISGAVALRDSDEIMLGAVRLTFIDPTDSILGKLDDIPAFEDQATVAGQGLEADDLDDDDEGDDDEDDGEDEADNSGEQQPAEEAIAPPEAEDLAPEGMPPEGMPPEGMPPEGVPEGDAEVPVEDPVSVDLLDEEEHAAPGNKTEIIILVSILVLVTGLAGGLAYYLLM